MTGSWTRVTRLILAGLIVLSVFPAPTVASSEATSHSVQYEIALHPSSHEVIGEATITTNEPIEVSFGHLLYVGNQQKTLEILSGASKIGGGKYRVEPTDGVAKIRYRITSPPQAEVVTDDPQTVLGENYAVFSDGSLFPLFDESGPASIRVSIDTPDNWKVFTATGPMGHNWTVGSFEKFERITVVAGRVKFYQEGTHYGIPTHNLWFNVSNPHSGHLISLEDYYSLSPAENGRQHNREIAFYAARFSKMIGQNPPKRIITTPIHNGYWRGWWDTDHGHRPGHVAHHVGHFYFPFNTSIANLNEGISSYYGDRLASEYRNEPRHLGDRYLRHIILDNTVDRLDTGKVRPYIYSPQLAWYLDYQIQQKSDGEYDFADVLEYILNQDEYKYNSIKSEEIPDIVDEATGVDVSDEYTFAMEQPDEWTDKTLPIIRTQYYDEFEKELNYQRNESLAPDIIYYAYLEIQIEQTPSASPHRISAERPYYTVDSYLFEQQAMGDFIQDLQANRPVTKEEFKTILNSYTDGQSDDFFHYYSKYGRDPNMTDLRSYLDGEYQTIVQKQLYVQDAIQNIDETTPESSRYSTQEALSHLRKSREYLTEHEISKALNSVNMAISRVDSIRKMDTDGDGIPDVQEYSEGLDPESPDSDDDGVRDSNERRDIVIDGYLGEWRGIDTESTKGTGSVESLKVTRYDGSLYIGMKFDKPFYTYSDAEIQVTGRKGRAESSVDVIRISVGKGPGAFPPGMTSAYSIENYSAVGPRSIEMRIPEEYLQFKEVPETLDISVEHKSKSGSYLRIRDVKVLENWGGPNDSHLSQNDEQGASTTADERTSKTQEPSEDDQETASTSTTRTETPGLGYSISGIAMILLAIILAKKR